MQDSERHHSVEFEENSITKELVHSKLFDDKIRALLLPKGRAVLLRRRCHGFSI